jgi:predicted metal-dependent hydrolase
MDGIHPLNYVSNVSEDGFNCLMANVYSEPRELIAKPDRAPFTLRVRFEFNLNPGGRPSTDTFVAVSGRQIPITLIRNPRARRYLLRLRLDGSVRVTIPRGGSVTEARRFAERNTEWLARQMERLPVHPVKPKPWLIGTEILFRGEPVKLEVGVNGESGMIQFGSEVVSVTSLGADFRPAIERYLWRLAAKELPPKAHEYATLHQLPVRRIAVRNQRSRWGSCSRRGAISLNWRLIQTSAFVRDYILVHEIMHLREMNHSLRFWREVERACPDYESAKQWLKQHSSLLK